MTPKGKEAEGGQVEEEETTSNSISNAESTPEQEVKGTFEFQLVGAENDDHVFDDDWSDTDGTESEVELDAADESVFLPDVVPVTSAEYGTLVVPNTTEERLENLAILGVDKEDSDSKKEDKTPVATLERDTVSPFALGSPLMRESISGLLAKSPSSDPGMEFGSCLENFQPTYSSRFIENQPLYQHYHQESARQALRVARNESMSSTDTAEEESILGAASTFSLSLSASARWCEKRKRFVASSNFGSQRSLWCELPEVKRAGLLDALGDQEKKLQEAMFEVITSEASYLRSLNILLTHFMAAPELSGNQNLSSVISSQDRKYLFSNILKVRDCSESLLSALESNFEEDLKLEDVCGLLCEHFSKFDVYVKYCSNQVYQDRTLRRLRLEDGKFAVVLQGLEGNSVCEGLDMRSFLMLPMQRVTRYPLLVDAIYQRTQKGTKRYENAKKALALANKVVMRCNEGARAMERVEQLLEIDRKLIYKRDHP